MMVTRKQLEDLFRNLQKTGAPPEAILVTGVGVVKQKNISFGKYLIPVVESVVMPKDCIIIATGDLKQLIEQHLEDDQRLIIEKTKRIKKWV
ncbi:MAG: hypothetical protein V1685_04480 [Parcubacteria group bacterium]